MMAHDSQMKDDSSPDPSELSGKLKRRSTPSLEEKTETERLERAKRRAVIFEKWMRIYAAQYEQGMSKETIEGYKLGLAEIQSPELLDRAFLRAMKGASRFRPDVAQVLAAFGVEAEISRPRGKHEVFEQMSKEERERFSKEVMEEMRKKFPDNPLFARAGK